MSEKTPDSINLEKRTLRKQIKQILAKYHENMFAAENESNRAADIFLDSQLYTDAANLCIYVACNNELNINKIIYSALNQGKTVTLPRIEPNTTEMNFYFLKSDIPLYCQLKKGSYDIYEPLSSLQKMDPENLPIRTAMIIPGLAFTRSGSRLGHGKGYYDRYIEKILNYNDSIHLPEALVGACFDIQIFENIPVSSTDISMTHILSPNGLIQCNKF